MEIEKRFKKKKKTPRKRVRREGGNERVGRAGVNEHSRGRRLGDVAMEGEELIRRPRPLRKHASHDPGPQRLRNRYPQAPPRVRAATFP